MTNVRTQGRWGVGLSAVSLCCGLALFSGQAWAVFVDIPETGAPGILSLRADPVPMEFAISPGVPAQVQIAADLVGPTSPLTLQFTRDGDLVTHPQGLIVQLQSCAQPWSSFPAAPTCASGAVPVLGPIAASDPSLGVLVPAETPASPTAPIYLAGTVSSTQSSYLLATLSIPDTPETRNDETLMGLETTIGFGFSVSGDGTVPTNPPVVPPRAAPSGLSNTGLDIFAILLIGGGALGMGLALRSARRQTFGGSQ